MRRNFQKSAFWGGRTHCLPKRLKSLFLKKIQYQGAYKTSGPPPIDREFFSKNVDFSI